MIERETTIAEVRAIAALRSVLAAHEQRGGVCVICQVAKCRPWTMAVQSLVVRDGLSPLRPHPTSPG